jgi:UDP:flavonoid glycosyltransferase YjiC (YdhE family)
MNVLVIGLGSAGDVHPMAALALALRRRGHRATLAACPAFEPLARRAGLEFIGLGAEEEHLLPVMRPVYEIVAQHSRSSATLVVAPAKAFGARIASERLSVPLVTAHLQPSLLRSVHQPPIYGFPDVLGRLPRPLRRLYLRAVDRFFMDRRLAPEVNAFRAELGLSPIRRIFDSWVHSEHLVLGLFPDWFAPPQPDWPPNVHLTGFPLVEESSSRGPSAELADFLDAGEAPVVFIAESANTQAREHFRVSVEVCRAGGRRGILLTRFPELLPPRLCEGVRHFDCVPLSEVLPRASAVVHHGGIGTVAQALAAGAPQLVVPCTRDQPDNAVRVCRLGVGSMLLPKEYKTGAVLQGLKRLLNSPDVLENCRRRARGLAGNTALDKACLVIEQFGGQADRVFAAKRGGRSALPVSGTANSK